MPGPNTVAPTASAMPAMPYQTARLALLLAREAAEREDEQDGGREIGGGDETEAHRAPPHDFWNMASIRRVTRKPPTMLMVAIRNESSRQAHHQPVAGADLQQRAEDDDAGDARW